jgi:uncharacterized protein (DUF58 family)
MAVAASSPGTTPTKSSVSYVDAQTLMAVRNLELRARIVVQGFWNGLHRSPYHGFSVEFTEYRQYTPGDDPRYLDWRLYARSDRYYIKKFEDETNLRCYLLVDNSKSMGYGSLAYNKAQYANTLAATFAYFLYGQGDAVGLLTFDERIREYLPARYRTGHLRHMMLALEKPAGGTQTDLAAPLKRIVELVRKRGLMVVLSDFLSPLDTLERSLSQLTASGHEVMVFQILDPAERDFKFEKASFFLDMESGNELYIEPAEIREDYLQKLKQHQAALEAICQKLGVGFRKLYTDSPLDQALFDYLRERMQRGKQVKQRGGGAR